MLLVGVAGGNCVVTASLLRRRLPVTVMADLIGQ